MIKYILGAAIGAIIGGLIGYLGKCQWQRLNYHVQPMDRGSYRCIFGDLYCKEIGIFSQYLFLT
jgi:hypothetical protein